MVSCWIRCIFPISKVPITMEILYLKMDFLEIIFTVGSTVGNWMHNSIAEDLCLVSWTLFRFDTTVSLCKSRQDICILHLILEDAEHSELSASFRIQIDSFPPGLHLLPLSLDLCLPTFYPGRTEWSSLNWQEGLLQHTWGTPSSSIGFNLPGGMEASRPAV